MTWQIYYFTLIIECAAFSTWELILSQNRYVWTPISVWPPPSHRRTVLLTVSMGVVSNPQAKNSRKITTTAWYTLGLPMPCWSWNTQTHRFYKQLHFNVTRQLQGNQNYSGHNWIDLQPITGPKRLTTYQTMFVQSKKAWELRSLWHHQGYLSMSLETINL